jgi:hypothetical protein
MQDRVIRENIIEMEQYILRLQKANFIEMKFRREILEYLYTVAFPRIGLEQA